MIFRVIQRDHVYLTVIERVICRTERALESLGRIAVITVAQGAVPMTNHDNGGAPTSETLRTISAEYGWPDHKVETRTAISMCIGQLSLFAVAYDSSGINITITEGAPIVIFKEDTDGRVPASPQVT